jgi:flagellar biosynthesis protein FliR
MPIFSQVELPPKFRIYVVLGFCFVSTPLLKPLINVSSDISFALMGIQCVRELLIGFAIGVIGKALMYAMDLTGSAVGLATGLSNAQVFNPASGSQTMLPSSLLLYGAAMFMLCLDLHHLIIKAVFHSYTIVPFGGEGFPDDLAKSILSALSHLFSLGLQFSYPFLILSIVFQLAMGLLNKMISQMQVFFIAMPVQILVGLFLMGAMISTILFTFCNLFEAEFKRLLGMP